MLCKTLEESASIPIIPKTSYKRRKKSCHVLKAVLGTRNTDWARLARWVLSSSYRHHQHDPWARASWIMHEAPLFTPSDTPPLWTESDFLYATHSLQTKFRGARECLWRDRHSPEDRVIWACWGAGRRPVSDWWISWLTVWASVTCSNAWKPSCPPGPGCSWLAQASLNKEEGETGALPASLTGCDSARGISAFHSRQMFRGWVE